METATESLQLDIAGLNAVLKTALDGVVVMDPAGVVRGWNDVAGKTFGIAAQAAIGRRMSEVIIPERYRAAHEAGLARFMRTGEGPVIDTHIEIAALCGDGTEKPVELSITFTEHFGQPLFLGFLRDISERREGERLRQLLIDELNHRVKNLLGVVSGLAHQTLRNSATLDEFGESFAGRLSALGRSHELLTERAWDNASLAALVAALVEPFADDTGRVEMSGEDIVLTPRDFLTLGMILYELLTNAAKYGALADPPGRLRIAWREAEIEGEDAIELNWRESSARPVTPPKHKGFGTAMIDFSARHDLMGAPIWDWTGGGLAFTLRFAPRR